MSKNEKLAKLTVEQKIKLVTGKDNWSTQGYEEQGIDSIKMNDGPHGVRAEYTDENGQRKFYLTTAYPCAAACASTWNRELVHELGKHLANECAYVGTDILLGPGVNIKRTPLCGRNFEYYSEDPYLAGELAASYINGLQENGIGSCIKHFAANNQEYDRGHISSEIDERTLREIYLKPFEKAIKQSQPWAVMCSYNRINGIYASQNKKLQNDILRDEWNFEGMVISDWGATHDRGLCLKSGLDVEMPHCKETFDELSDDLRKGLISESDLDIACERIIGTAEKIAHAKSKRNCVYDKKSNREFAEKIAEESIVLLKNDDGILPIKDNVKNIAVIGRFAEQPVAQGGGSAGVVTDEIESPLTFMRQRAESKYNISYAAAYLNGHPVCAPDCVGNAIATAAMADIVIVFVGDTEKTECEGIDRTSIKLHQYMEDVIHRVTAVNENVIVVIQAGSAIDMSGWINEVKGVLFQYYGGNSSGDALTRIIFGDICPSGKLAETFPTSLEDTPTAKFDSYPGNGPSVVYNEGLMVGYRYYDTAKVKTLFPFGYGLSYTSFEYSDMHLSSSDISNGEEITVSFNVKNTGECDGKETVQLYIEEIAPCTFRPRNELKNFTKVSLKAGEEKRVELKVGHDDFAYYSVALNDWHVNGGRYRIKLGASVEDIRLSSVVNVSR